MRFHSVLWLALISSAFVLFVGCADGRLETEPVSGVITLDGVPLAGASVSFSPKMAGQGAIGFGKTNEKGEYIIQAMNGRPDEGTLPGEYAVTVKKYKEVPTGRKVAAPGSGEMVDEMKGVLMLPEQYASSKKTPFSATVVKGKNRFDYDVKTK